METKHPLLCVDHRELNGSSLKRSTRPVRIGRLLYFSLHTVPHALYVVTPTRPQTDAGTRLHFDKLVTGRERAWLGHKQILSRWMYQTLTMTPG